MAYIKYNLQFFQGEKTEQATPKKRRESREKGQVVQSKDIGSSAVLLVVFLVISFFSDYFVEKIYGIFFYVMEMASNTGNGLLPRDVLSLGNYMIFTLITIIGPLLLAALITGVLIDYMQVGFLFTMEPLKFKLDKINPLKGFKRLFSLKSMVEMIKSILKAGGILILSYQFVANRQNELMEVMGFGIEASVAMLWSFIFGIVWRAAVFLFVISIFDFIYKKWENNKELKMSKQEIKDEYKQMEGDPQIKSKIREKQRQMAMSRMMQDVPGADVIITNPTHYAVALLYNREESMAPKVVAKGRDLIAQNIKKIAKENDVPVVENKPLARSLYAAVEIGEYIPSELFEAVADVLAYVYKLKNRSS
ncbi:MULTISPECIES: flagellar biosynthesis protein FlhB [unclassified Fusibacter]|uniref:flagellar biosynthesis protein FlhB n=1 Tax=unclassified Fusibacter TaxID=2624464 RepID=UPI001011CD39|nr:MULTISPECIES: flagellar biosynthesis protein FlhB [unclassified Fusibacter]MCK8058775.1 flagellar biosynthesis protein FlhB [Fusibacter sp. A2]NPE21849.1 flagellar biosynthesis protein FlhB [Fusibacter sp. A1]RXV61421.1 flagellar biosynthesis protein FlhB [Fusibacter sp. A1]